MGSDTTAVDGLVSLVENDYADERGDKNCAVLPTTVKTQSLSAVASHGGITMQEHVLCVRQQTVGSRQGP